MAIIIIKSAPLPKLIIIVTGWWTALHWTDESRQGNFKCIRAAVITLKKLCL